MLGGYRTPSILHLLKAHPLEIREPRGRGLCAVFGFTIFMFYELKIGPQELSSIGFLSVGFKVKSCPRATLANVRSGP